MITVHVYLLNEGTDVWVPRSAEHVHDDIYRIVGCNDEDEEVLFAAGSLVRCEMRTLSGGDCLVAMKKVD